MVVQSIGFDAAAEIEKRKTEMRSRAMDGGFSGVFREAVSRTGAPSAGGLRASAFGRGAAQLEATELDAIFAEASATYGVPVDLLKAVAKAESNFDPDAVSSAGAVGVMQLMPGTAKALGVTNSYDARQNIMGGAKYLSQKLAQYNGDTTLALAAYNAGSGNVAKYGGVPPFKETQNYIRKIMGYLGQDLSAGRVQSRNTGNYAAGYASLGADHGAYNRLASGYKSLEANGLSALQGQELDKDTVLKMVMLSYQQMGDSAKNLGQISTSDEKNGLY